MKRAERLGAKASNPPMAESSPPTRLDRIWRTCDPRRRVSTNRCRRRHPAQSRINRQIVDPATVTFVADHDRTHNFVSNNRYQKPVRISSQFSTNVFPGIVPRPYQATSIPKIDHGRLVLGGVRPHHDPVYLIACVHFLLDHSFLSYLILICCPLLPRRRMEAAGRSFIADRLCRQGNP